MRYASIAALIAPILHPLLVLLAWPFLSFAVARAMILYLVPRAGDFFLRILAGSFLSAVGGVLAACLLLYPLLAGIGLWSTLLFRR